MFEMCKIIMVLKIHKYFSVWVGPQGDMRTQLPVEMNKKRKKGKQRGLAAVKKCMCMNYENV